MIRRAIGRDFEDIHRLIQELAKYEKAPTEVITSPEILKEHCSGNKPLAFAWVLEIPIPFQKKRSDIELVNQTTPVNQVTHAQSNLVLESNSVLEQSELSDEHNRILSSNLETARIHSNSKRQENELLGTLDQQISEIERSRIVGAAVCYVRYSTWKGPVFYLEDLIVEEAFRKQGFGKQILDVVIEFAKSQNFKRVVWQVLDWNTPAIEFYKKYEVSFDHSWINVTLDLE
jgi:GNAT superfamily N-acetyltransferase